MKNKKNDLFGEIINVIDKNLSENIPDYQNKKDKIKKVFEQPNKKEEKPQEKIKDNKKYCTNCGTELDEDDKFCEKCGKSIKKIKKEHLTSEKEPKEEKNYKCPNCGASLKSFTSNCPYCRSEIRNIKVSKNIEEFTSGLERLNNKELPKYEGNDSLLKKIIGTDFKEEDARIEFESKSKIKRQEEIASYITSYPVPNSKEDLLEFMILSTTNINVKTDNDDIIKQAWLKKMNQIYEKAKLTLSGNDLEKINELYNNKNNEIKKKKNKTILYITFGVIGWLLLIILITNPILALSLLFLLLSIFTYLYKIINNGIISIYSLKINTKIINYFCIVLLILSIIFGIKGIFFNKEKIDQATNDYYNEETEKYNIDVDIVFKENTLFNRYNVDIKVYDQEETLYHGIDKSLEFSLPKGKHEIKFSGDGMSKTVKLNVKGDTYVKYEITCHEYEIGIRELELYYNDNNINNNEEEDKTEEEKIVMEYIPNDFIGKNYKDVENEIKKIGFTNIKLEKELTTDKNNISETVSKLTINGEEFELNSEFNKDAEVKIIYWLQKDTSTDEKIEKSKETKKKSEVSYSTNDSKTVKLGNQGVYAYKRYGNREYDLFYIIDFDEGYVYYFIDGTIGDTTCSKYKIKSGNLNDTLIFTINDGGIIYEEGLHFKWKNQPDHLIYEDNDHFEYDFYSTDLSSTLSIKNSRTCN